MAAGSEQDYYRIERILEWNKCGTYDRMIDHHKRFTGSNQRPDGEVNLFESPCLRPAPDPGPRFRPAMI